jgi:hypothetical protein
MKITMANAEHGMMRILHAGLVPGLLSSPGVGKSNLAHQIAAKNNLKVIDLRLSSSDPTDMNGFPKIMQRTIEQAESGIPEKAGYVPMDTFPIEQDALPVKTWKTITLDDGAKKRVPDTYYKGWLLLLDEFNSAPLSVQAAAYKLVLDKAVGLYKLHHRVAIMVAGNLTGDKAITNRISTALQSRIVWLEIEVCVVAWDIWAIANDIDHRVRSFIKFKPDALHKFDPNHNEHTFPCPRTWEFMSKIIKPIDKIEYIELPVMAGTIGEGMARDFYTYTQVCNDLLTIKEILADPTGVPMTDKSSVQYAYSGMVGHNMTKGNADALMGFVSRMEIDFQVIVLRAAVSKDKAIMQVAGVKTWLATNAKEMV